MKDVVFSHNGANRPESDDTTYMFCRVRKVMAPGAKFAVSDCILLVMTMSLYFALGDESTRPLMLSFVKVSFSEFNSFLIIST